MVVRYKKSYCSSTRLSQSDNLKLKMLRGGRGALLLWIVLLLSVSGGLWTALNMNSQAQQWSQQTLDNISAKWLDCQRELRHEASTDQTGYVLPQACAHSHVSHVKLWPFLLMHARSLTLLIALSVISVGCVRVLLRYYAY